MISSVKPGQFLFAAALALFGAQYLLDARPPTGAAPGPFYQLNQLVPIGRPGGTLECWAVGIALLAAAVCIAAGKAAPWAAALAGSALVLDSLIVDVPRLVVKPSGGLTSCFELLAMGGGGWVLAGALARELPGSPARRSAAAALSLAGRLLFAVSMLIFGVDHFRFAKFIATLVPAWLPGHLFWAYFFGVAFIAAASSLATRVKERLAAPLLGTMFMVWFLVLHLPRSFADPHNGNEWTSAFVALALCGCSWIMAGAARPARLVFQAAGASADEEQFA